MVSEKVFLEKGVIPPCLEDIEDAEQVERILKGLKEEVKEVEKRQILIDECD